MTLESIGWVKVSSFIGVVSRAIHYYAEISVASRFGVKTAGPIDVHRTLTAAQAMRLTKRDNMVGGIQYRWEKGQEVTRWEDREELEAAALKEVRKKWPHVSLVCEGNRAVMPPHRVLWSTSEQFTKEANALYKELEDRYDSNTPVTLDDLDEAESRWNRLIEKYLEKGEG